MKNPSVVFAGAGSLAAIALATLKANTDTSNTDKSNASKTIAYKTSAYKTSAHKTRDDADGAIDAYAIARSDKRGWSAHSDLAGFWQGGLADDTVLANIAKLKPQVVVVTLVPNGRGEDGYRKGYLEPLTALVKCLVAHSPATYVLFASSTAVYHQTSGEWVDEQTIIKPAAYSGQVMLEAESCLRDSGLPYCTLRLGGIYGPDRDYLIRQVQAGQGGGMEFTNRIHEQDAGRLIAFLMAKRLAKEPMPECLVVCDSSPAPSKVVREYIAQQLDISLNTLQPSASGRGGNKRCSNARLLSLGFDLHYPSYREGYRREYLLQP